MKYLCFGKVNIMQNRPIKFWYRFKLNCFLMLLLLFAQTFLIYRYTIIIHNLIVYNNRDQYV